MQVDQSLKLNFPFFAVCHTSDNVVRIRYACSDDANLELNRTDVWQERKLWANFFVSAKLQAFYLFPYQFIRYVLRISVNAGFRSTFFENQKNWVKKSDFGQKNQTLFKNANKSIKIRLLVQNYFKHHVFHFP